MLGQASLVLFLTYFLLVYDDRIAIFAGILFWIWMWGVPGMLLAIPMMVVVKAVCDRVEGLQPIGNMLGE